MKVLFLLRLWPIYGGGETVTRILANAFVERGLEVHVVFFKRTENNDNFFVDSRIVEHELRGHNCDEYNQDLTCAGLVCSEVCSIIDLHGIDIVIDQWFPFEYIQGIKPKTNAKVIKCWHTAFHIPRVFTDSVADRLRLLAKPFFENRARMRSVRNVDMYLPYVDKYVFLSDRFVDQYYKYSSHKVNSKIEAIPNPLTFNQNISNDDLNNKENIALVVGRMEESYKKLSYVIKAWHIIERSGRNTGWRLVFVGDGSSLEWYKTLSLKLGLRRVEFMGYQNPIDFYKKSKLFIMTSRYEGFAMTLVESQQMGVVPIVMDSVVCVKDIIQQRVNGIITPYGDINKLSYNLQQLMNNENKRQQYMIKGFESCKKFEVNKIVDRWITLFNHMCNG